MARAGALQGQDLSHVLRVAMDIEGDPHLLDRQARMLDEAARGMLSDSPKGP
ncbi:hypothetical protein CENSYa_1143 [Cenarchaeum symbiosum A]|uniref:Uncharacterized protein n=1 Tax=Cenarchaeum symbiosum (strain A) TaxID=414004 RepID=A0RWQ3_CENSY|nr:hypothetical protein CENSYa_1143 [Cenarchaeum symbiosum A]